MNCDFDKIWEWLYSTSNQAEEVAPAQPEVSDQPNDPLHRISDDTLLALEREAEVAVRLQAAQKADSVIG